jgi:hypothetical protein
MLAYHQLAICEEERRDNMPEVNMYLIETMTKQYTSHRDVHNHDSGFINELLQGMSRIGKSET